MKDRYLSLIEETLDEVLPKDDERPAVLSSAMRYAVGTGGKRLRPLLCVASAVAVGGKAENAKYPAAAIELLHNYTLVHDDLPAMDNDETRRGKPTVWKQYGEANAVLAGDALLSLAFGVAAKAPRESARVVAVLSERAVGVVAGQVEDLEGVSNGTAGVDDDLVDFIYTHKTADLFVAAAMMGGYAGGGTEDEVKKLHDYALNLGLAFQFEDDLLDGDSPYSEEKTRQIVAERTAAAIDALSGLPGDISFLRNLALSLVNREV